MNNSLKSTLTIICLFFAINFAKGQALMPQASSSQTVIQDFGLGKITLTYSRPNMNNRKIFGSLEPYGAVWRTGANGATTLEFTDEVTINGNKLAPGKYALFTIPNKDSWTIIFNKNTNLWGAYEYKKEEDVLRMDIKPSKSGLSVETFSISFSNVKPNSINIDLAWENTLVTIPLLVDVDTKVMENIAKAMQGDKKPYFAAAQYYYNNDKDIEQALKWVNEAEKADMKAPWFKYWKAKILLKKGDKTAAIATAKEGIELAKAVNNQEYVNLNQSVINLAK